MVSRLKSSLHHSHDRKRNSFPEVSPMAFSHSELPCCYETYAETKDEYGFTVTPFIRNESYRYETEARRNYDVAGRIARCKRCHGYINKYCEVTSARWVCSICRERNVFNKAQTRYRNLSPQSLPELQDELVDFRQPLLDAADGATYDASKYAATPDERPLVHLFLVQESMGLDAMQAAIEALSAAVRAMHPEVQVALVTFSHRIGVYRFRKGSAVPAVEYVPFVAVPADTGDGLVGRSSRHSAEPHTEASIFEGHDLSELAPAYKVQLLLALEQVEEFRAAACPVGDCRDALLAAVGSLFDAFPADTPNLTASDGLTPKMLLGPTLDAVTAWLAGRPSSSEEVYAPEGVTSAGTDGSLVSDYTDADHFAPASGPVGPSDLVSLLSNLTLGLWSGMTGGASKPTAAAGNSAGKARRGSGRAAADKVPPADSCSGVVLHLFLDSPQDLPLGSHRSVAPSVIVPKDCPQRSAVPRTLLDTAWMQDAATTLAGLSVSANVWCVVNFESHEIGLDCLHSLATTTGGAVHRTVLGLQPAQERVRLAEALRRTVTAAHATRCILKVRALNLLQPLPETISGGAVLDPDLPGVMRIATCTPEKTIGMNFTYDVALKNDTKKYAELVLQFAFSYETLAETSDPIETPVDGTDAPADEREGGSSEDDVSLYTDSSDEAAVSSKRPVGADSHRARQPHHRQADKVHADPLSGKRKSQSQPQGQAGKNSADDPRSKDFCGMREGRDGGYYEQCADQLGLTAVQAQVRKYYHVADAKLAACRQAAVHSKHMGVPDGLMLPQDLNREGDLSCEHKLLVVKYLRVYTVRVACSQHALHLHACENPATYACLQMRRALQLERQHRLYRKYTPENTQNYGDSAHRTAETAGYSGADAQSQLQAFTDKINMQSPGVTLLVNRLIERIITISREYAVEKQLRARDGASGQRGQSAELDGLSLTSPSDVDAILVEVLTYPIVKDMMVYTFAAADKLNHYTPTVGADNTAYLADDGCYFESLATSVDAVNASRILYPRMLAVTDDLRAGDELLSLTRRSVVTSGQQYVFLDAGTECLLYRSSTSSAPASGGAGPRDGTSGGDRFASLLELAALDAKTAEVCANGAMLAKRETLASAAVAQQSVTPADGAAGKVGQVQAEEIRAPRVLGRMYEALFLPNYLQRRLRNLDLVPRVQVCESGSASASAFAAHLLEDHGCSGLVYAQFVQFVTQLVKRDILES